jgi:hypothetical protein
MSPWFVLSELQTFLNVRQNRLEMRLSRQILREKRSGPLAKHDLGKQADMQSWPRIKVSRLFVLSELQPFLMIMHLTKVRLIAIINHCESQPSMFLRLS